MVLIEEGESLLCPGVSACAALQCVEIVESHGAIQLMEVRAGCGWMKGDFPERRLLRRWEGLIDGDRVIDKSLPCLSDVVELVVVDRAVDVLIEELVLPSSHQVRVARHNIGGRVRSC